MISDNQQSSKDSVNLVEYDQPSTSPVPKVAAAGAAGAGVTAVVTLLALSGVTVPDDVSQSAQTAIVTAQILYAAVQAVIVFFVAYFKRDKKPAPVVEALEVATNQRLKG